ncbi:TlpA family protein disulfide reductase [Szabonella alba]|uniref:TlpA family protein disulfide reductase n=1 Tax=Szabonella alba TaxID=2804194 RepID=A0A8K0VBV9_9RHOB|nr:TlpA disulfide reductase family protein [Szabonella alba]MBL4918126.1 TlpA family protein disulfide reductase [Szabonella alba]
MRGFLVVLYTALALGANPALADATAAAALREGDMRKLAFHESPQPVPQAALVDLAEAPRSLDEWQGQWVVLNFWATWCAPCRHEMPALDRLAALMADEGVAVVTVATGRNPVPGIERFFDEIGMQNLPALRDPKSELARAMGVLGLPVTVILNPEGQEVARLIGDAEWDSANAQAVLRALTAGPEM